MRKIKTEIAGLFILENNYFEDNRGSFVKFFNKEIFINLKLDYNFHEQFYSTSKKGVIRGMHFQKPPYAHSKLVYVTKGEILDVILDIRKKSPTYGKYVSVELSSVNNRSVFIPEGCAHGFLSKEEDSIVTYMQTSGFQPNSDGGINYNSFGMDWGVGDFIISEKDKSLISFSDLQSPF